VAKPLRKAELRRKYGVKPVNVAEASEQQKPAPDEDDLDAMVRRSIQEHGP
jgi:hypothetical protein